MKKQTRSDGALVKHPAIQLYSLRGSPQEILKSVQLFHKVGLALTAYRRRLLYLLLGATAGMLVIGLILTHLAPDIWAIVTHLAAPAVLFLAVTCFLRALFYSVNPRTRLPGPGGNSFVMLLFLSFIMWGMIAERWYMGPGRVLETALPAAVAGVVVNAAFVALLLGWYRYFRIKRVQPQQFELDFCWDVLRHLLPEAGEQTRCDVEINPFPAEWSQVLDRSGRKAAHFDCLLRLKLPLSDKRVFTFSAIHRRTSKGQRKHKGWKHKVKLKYALRAEDLDSEAFAAAERRLSAELKKREPNVASTPSENPHKFETSLEKTRPMAARRDNSVVAVQTLETITSVSKDPPPSLLPHPQLVLRVVRSVCQSAL